MSARAPAGRAAAGGRFGPTDGAALLLLLIGAAVAVAVATSGAEPAAPVVRIVSAWAPTLAAWWLLRLGARRIGLVALAAGALSVVQTLAGAEQPWLNLASVVAVLGVTALNRVCLLLYPGGAFRSRGDRRLVLAHVALAGAWLPIVLVAPTSAIPQAWIICRPGCPPNPSPLQVSDGVGGLLAGGATVLSGALMLLVLASTARYARRATPPLARIVVLAVALSALRSVLQSWLVLDEDMAPGDADALRLASLLALAASWIALPAGIAVRRLDVAHSLERLLAALQTARIDAIDGVLGRALRDPSALLVAAGPDGGLLDVRGRPVRAGERVATALPGASRLAVLHHGERVDDDLVLAAGTAAATALETARDAEALAWMTDDLRAARARAAAAALAERRRIERDLHDGAEQRLAAAERALVHAAALADRGDADGIAALARARDAVGSALDGVRTLAHGIYPAALRAQGLRVALESTTTAQGGRVRVLGPDPGRFPPALEEHAYFCCRAAIDAVAAEPGATATVAFEVADGALRFAVEGGGAPPAPVEVGGVLVALKDRLESLGGGIERAQGAEVAGRIPLRADKSVQHAAAAAAAIRDRPAQPAPPVAPSEPAGAAPAARCAGAWWPLHCATAAAIAVGLAAAVVRTVGPHDDEPRAMALMLALVVAAPALSGWLLVRFRNATRLGWLVLATAYASGAWAFHGIDVGWLDLVGHLAHGPLIVLTAACVLAHPTGRLRSRWERSLIVVVGGGVLALELAAALLRPAGDVPDLVAGCSGDCPTRGSLLALADGPGPLLGRIAAVVGLAFTALACATLLVRLRDGSPLQRRTQAATAVVATAAALAAVVLAVLLARDAARALVDAARMTSDVLLIVLWATLPTGILLRRLQAASGLERLLAALQTARREEIDGHVARALDDPAARLVPASELAAALEPGRAATPIAATVPHVVVHDATWNGDRAFVQAVGAAAARASLRLQHRDRLAELARELGASRVRATEAAVAERRRIERDLHDGAQQRLVATRIRLGLALGLARGGSPRAREELATAGGELREALAAVRELAHGIHPAILRSEGLVAALEDAVARGAVAVELVADEVPRALPVDVEAHVYFACLEALQNVAKHAGASARATLRLEARDGVLAFAVEDDGPGLRPRRRPTGGRGLVGMRDRVESLGGRLELGRSRLGGLAVRAEVPLPAASPTLDLGART